jgi:hypothetical protein
LESVSAGLRVSRLDSEIDEASNGKAPLLTKPGLSKTVVAEMNRCRYEHSSRHRLQQRK